MESKSSLKQHFYLASRMIKFTLTSLMLYGKEAIINSYKHIKTEQSFKAIEAFSIV